MDLGILDWDIASNRAEIGEKTIHKNSIERRRDNKMNINEYQLIRMFYVYIYIYICVLHIDINYITL